MPDPEEDRDHAQFERGCFQLVVVFVGLYLVVAVMSTVVSVSTGTHWWILGWFWPHLSVAAIYIGFRLGEWSEGQ